MKGKHRIIIETERLRFEFEIKRNITIVQGNSATGKTTLVDLIQTYGRYKSRSGIRMVSDVSCVVFSGDSFFWKSALHAIQDSIVFIDEDYAFIYSTDFAHEVENSSNYFVLITRQPLYNLPYSINEIYGIRTSGRYHYPEKIYHEFYSIYKETELHKNNNVILMVEDEKSGFQFFSRAFPKAECKSGGGNSSLVSRLDEIPLEKTAVVIADGAAFGAYISKVVAIATDRKNLGMYFPESFEWIILRSGVLNIKDIDSILAHPEEYIQSNRYFSWERYFTDLIESVTRDDIVRRYSKSNLNSFYLDGKNKEAIVKVLPEELRYILSSE